MIDYCSYDTPRLLELLKADDSYAFTAFYERYFAQLYLQAYRRLSDSEAAKDIVQDIFTSIWERRATLDINAGVSSYLYTAVRNRVIDYMARRQTRADHSEELARLLDTGVAGTDRLVREKQLEALIENEIEQLPPQVRRVFELSRKANLSHAEIGLNLHLSEQTVRGYIKSALRVLRVKLSGLGSIMFW